MLTKLTIRNFKRFGEVEIELGSPVVFIGPNNSEKTSAMQALALWDIGLKRWNEKRSGKSTPEKRPGVTVNRRDLVAIPIEVRRMVVDFVVGRVLTQDGVPGEPGGQEAATSLDNVTTYATPCSTKSSRPSSNWPTPVPTSVPSSRS